ncbi:MAG: GNAT family N-acetyltransferase [Candidatus Hodarchaeales archaeon]
MVHEIPHENLKEFLPLFKEHIHFRNILEVVPTASFGRGFTDDLESPDIILFSCGYYFHFLTGNYHSVKIKELLDKIPEKHEIIVPSDEWEKVLRDKWSMLVDFTRTGFSSKNLVLKNIKKLIKPLPKEFTLIKVDSGNAEKFGYLEYPGGSEAFNNEAVGFCITEGEKLVSRAASSSLFNHEIDVFTSPKYRRKGFAINVSARLIEYCLENGIEPHWDAENELSVKLALKLGYTDPKPHKVYYWKNEPPER